MLGRGDFAKGQWALLYLLIIVFVASVGGFRASVLAAVLSFFAWNFFLLPPYGTLIVHDPKDWLSLFVFLIVGIAMGLQTSRMRDREADARAREQESALLSRLSAHLVSIASTHAMGEALRDEITAITASEVATLFLADASGNLIPASGTADSLSSDAIMRQAHWVYTHHKAIGLPYATSLTRLGVEGWPISVPHQQVLPGLPRQDICLPVQSSTRVEGVLYVSERSDREPYSPHDARLLVSIANLAASFLERQRLEEIATTTEALRESERLKSTLISSVSHELKTPLAAVNAAISSLLGKDVAWEPEAVQTELQAVQDDLHRLNDSIGALLDLSRLKADAWVPQRDWYELGEMISAMQSKLPDAERRRISYAISEELPPLHVDFQQWQQALQHLVENALAYSPPESPITIGATATPREVRLWVEDQGPGIPPAERERIFEQFYRGTTSTVAPAGTGLGLAITAEIVRFHGGRIWVEDVHPHGARFIIALPREETATGESQ